MQVTDEMVEAAAKIVCAWLNTSWDGLSDRDISDKFPDWAYPVYGPSLQGGKPALRKIMRAALEATLGARRGNASDLVNSLIGWANVLEISSGKFVNEDCRKAANCIEDLAGALKNFAMIEMPSQEPDHWPIFGKNAGMGWPIVGDFRIARAVLERWGLK